MKQHLALICSLGPFIANVAGLSAASVVDDPAAYERAIQPLTAGVPQVAVVRLRQLSGGNLPEARRVAVTAKLGEALVAADQPLQALTILAAPSLANIPEAVFARAQGLARLARWGEALPFYQQVAADASSALHSPALFGQAEALRALGRGDEALAVLAVLEADENWNVRARLRAVELRVERQDFEGAARALQAIEPMAAPQRKERRLLRGRVEAKRNRDKAIELYASILKNPEGATHPVLVATLFAMAEAQLQSHTPEAGDNYLEDFIERHPTDPELAPIFAKLDQLYAAQRQQSPHELTRWSNDPAQPRRALAQWYLARANVLLGRRDLARRNYEKLRAENPRRPELAAAFVEFAEFEMEEHRFDRALEILENGRRLKPAPIWSGRIDMLSATAQYRARRFDVAAQTFQRTARSAPDVSAEAGFNATLAWLQAGDPAQSAKAADELKKHGADEQTQGDLRLEQALVAAGRGEKNTADLLRAFLRDFPQHARASEAWVALAEFAFHAAPPRLDEARQNLARSLETQPTPAARERADYLTIWIEDSAAASDESKLIALAGDFLRKYPASGWVTDVRLKLAETYYRRQDFASAQTEFEILAKGDAASPVAEKARFFAAQCAMQSMSAGSLDRALVLFDEVVKKGGEWKWAARIEQAVIERKLGKPQEALTLYEEVLRGDALPAEKLEAFCGKGDVLYDLGATTPENYQRAIEAYEQLAAQPGVAPHWRNQALFKKGLCLEKLKRPADALATFYGIVEDEKVPAARREFFWFYKAGFNAARLLEEDAKWQPAAAVYEKLAYAGGSRSEEAKSRLNRLRLEHFLWDQ